MIFVTCIVYDLRIKPNVFKHAICPQLTEAMWCWLFGCFVFFVGWNFAIKCHVKGKLTLHPLSSPPALIFYINPFPSLRTWCDVTDKVFPTCLWDVGYIPAWILASHESTIVWGTNLTVKQCSQKQHLIFIYLFISHLHLFARMFLEGNILVGRCV